MTKKITLTEKWDLTQREAVLSSDGLKSWHDGDLRDLRTTLALAKNGHLTIDYTTNGIGRHKVSSQTGYVKCFTYLQRDVRAIFAKANYYDLDIVNAHPTIIQSLCEKHDIECSKLTNYNNNRDTYLNDIMALGYSRSEAKDEMFKVIYFGNINKNNKKLYCLKHEMMDIAEELTAINSYKYIIDTVKYDDKKNPLAQKLSLITQTHERECIEALLDIVQATHTVGSMLYDGIHVEKNDTPPEDLDLTQWSDYIQKRTDIQVKLSIKEFVINDKYLTNSTDGDISTSGYDPTFLDEIITYEEMKVKWEKICNKIVTQDKYILYDAEGDLVEMTPTTLRSAYGFITTLQHKTIKNKITFHEESFITKWINDPKTTKYQKVALVPPPLIPSKHTFNLWNGFEAEKYQHNHNHNQKVKFILNTIKHLTEDKYEYLLDWYASIIQYPANKPAGGAILLYGEQGSGKSTLGEIMYRILGESLYYGTAEPEKTIFGNFNKMRENRLLILIDETNPKTSFINNNLIKDMTTTKYFTVNEKNRIAYKSPCYARFMFTTNSLNSINIEKSDRRFTVWEIPNYKHHTKDHWNKFYSYIDDNEVIYDLYIFLKNRKITYNIVFDRPITELYNMMKDVNEDPIFKWLESYTVRLFENVDSDEPQTLLVETLFHSYKDWLLDNNFDRKVNNKIFGFILKKLYSTDSKTKLNGIDDRPKYNNKSAIIITPLLIKTLQQKNQS